MWKSQTCRIGDDDDDELMTLSFIKKKKNGNQAKNKKTVNSKLEHLQKMSQKIRVKRWEEIIYLTNFSNSIN